MSPSATWESEHQFYFSTSTAVTPTSLAESLVGLDGVLRHSARVIGKLVGANPKDIEIELRSVEIGSYKDNFLFRLFFGEGVDAEKKVEDLRKKLGLVNMTPKKLVGLATTAVILWAAYVYLTKSKDKPAAEKASQIIVIENSFNQVSKEAGMTPEQLKEILAKALESKKEQVQRDVIRLTHPDGHDTNGSIRIDGEEALSIPEEVLSILPQTYEKEQAAERTQDYIKRDLAIRALDLDRPGQGWAALAPDIADKRLPLTIGDEVDPAKVPVGKMQTADFSVVWKRDKKTGEEKATRIILHRIHRN